VDVVRFTCKYTKLDKNFKGIPIPNLKFRSKLIKCGSQTRHFILAMWVVARNRIIGKKEDFGVNEIVRIPSKSFKGGFLSEQCAQESLTLLSSK
jgi:hypothetical protein